uniref:Protein kinase domain-containing protein n=1 Tax=Ananas comosus var. bracteatus TaxID=296719 RepID=A0A6V7QQN9_ANACO
MISEPRPSDGGLPSAGDRPVGDGAAAEDDLAATEEGGGGGSVGREEAVADVSGKRWEVALLERPPRDGGAEALYVYRNTFNLLPRTIGRLGRLKTLKFFANEVDVLPPEAEDLVELRRLQVKVSSPRISGIPFRKLKSLKELELCKVPLRLSAFSILSEISGLKCLTKLSICHFSIRYLPPEIASLKKLEELDLSFNKLKNLPDGISELSALRSLKVANNKLVDLPSGISSLRCLESLDLSNNRLISLTSLNLASMFTLQYLNLQFNRIHGSCQIPSWISCDFRGNGDVTKGERVHSLVKMGVDGLGAKQSIVKNPCNGHIGSCSCLYAEASSSSRIHTAQKMRKSWKRRDGPQQRARQERLNFSRNRKVDDSSDDVTSKMVEENDSIKVPDMESKHPNMQVTTDEGNSIECSLKSSFSSEAISSSVDDDVCVQDSAESEKISLKKSCQDDFSCTSSVSTCLNKDPDFEGELEDSGSSINHLSEAKEVSKNSCKATKFFLNSKRHPDMDNNPKPRKFRKPFDDCSNLSYKYSIESFCSVDDHLPDGFYDAGRDRPFMSIQDYEQSFSLGSREIILLDREEDEELDAIVYSAQLLLSSLSRPSLAEREDAAADNLLRASILALFVSDCFGGSERGDSLMRTRRAVYLCDRVDPPIPCELVRGYLDFMPHAWNAVLVRRGNTWVRMVVDACYPTNIREETDAEYFCRYIPLNRLHIPLEGDNSPIFGFSFPSLSICKEIETSSTRSIFHCKIGTVDTAVKVRNLDGRVASSDEMRNFEYGFLAEVRMLGALRKHRCIVDIYGHQLSCKWISSGDGNEEYRLLQSIIAVEYVKGGSVKGYLKKLLDDGEKHVPINLAFHVARDVSCALVELHSKLIIHRDIKSENVLIDCNSKRSDGYPVVKLTDFDQSIPLHSSSHTCCIAHHGVHPPNVCVGTPRWMAPEVLQAVHLKNRYGLEVDIWSYGCFLLELLTLQVPYQGLSDSEIYDHLQRKQGPQLTPELEAFSSLDEPITRLNLGISSDAAAVMLKLLIDLFHQCTRGNPADRPTAENIYNSLCSNYRRPSST